MRADRHAADDHGNAGGHGDEDRLLARPREQPDRNCPGDLDEGCSLRHRAWRERAGEYRDPLEGMLDAEPQTGQVLEDGATGDDNRRQRQDHAQASPVDGDADHRRRKQEQRKRCSQLHDRPGRPNPHNPEILEEPADDTWTFRRAVIGRASPLRRGSEQGHCQRFEVICRFAPPC